MIEKGIGDGDGNMAIGLKKTMRLLLLLMLLSIEVSLPSAQVPPEKMIPLLIDRVAKFTIWPGGAGLDNDGSAAHFKMAIYGKHYFGNTLDIKYGHPNKKLKGKSVKLMYVRDVKDIPLDSHLIFIAEDLSRRRLSRLLEHLGDRPILTMASSDNFAAWGVHVNVVFERKTINDPFSKSTRITTASSLLINEKASRNAGFLFSATLKKAIAEGSKHGKNVDPYFEYQDKAERLEAIAGYVRWPVNAGMADKNKMFNIQVLGNNPFNSFLVNIYKKKRILGKRVNVQNVSRIADIRDDTNILFVCGSEKGKIAEILKTTAGKPILVIGDTPGFGEQGIHINYYYDGAWLKFEVNRGALKQSKLDIGYQVSTISRIKFIESYQR